MVIFSDQFCGVYSLFQLCYIFYPSKSGKTWLTCQLLANLSSITKKTPEKIVYVFSIWQKKLTEIRQLNLVDYFLQVGDDLEQRLKIVLDKTPNSLVIFDDLMLAKTNLGYISSLFAIGGRHSQMSMIFICQRLYLNDENIRIIRENSDYYILFKNPTNVNAVSYLGRQLASDSTLVSKIYESATEKPHSYLFINVTQNSSPQTQFLSEIFDRSHVVTTFIKKIIS